MKKILISTGALKPALSKLGQAINQKSVLPILTNLLCKVSDKEVELISSNLELTIFYRLQCEASESFEFLIPFELLNKIVALHKHAPLEFEVGKNVKVKGPDDNYEIKVKDKLENFPKLPELPKENSIDLNNDILQALHTAIVTTAKPELNAKLANVLLELSKGKITIASTDSAYVVFSKEFNNEQNNIEEILISQKAIKVLEGCDVAKLFYQNKAIGLECNNITIVMTRSEEKFVNFRKVFPPDWPANLTVQKDQLIEALNKCALSTDQLRTTEIKLKHSDNAIMLSANDSIIKVNATVEGKYSGEVEATSINSDKMMKILSQVSQAEISLAIHDKNKAIVVTTEDAGYKGLIMPIATN